MAFIDSDDYVSANYIQKMFTRMRHDQTDLVICEYTEVGPPHLINSKREKIPSDGVIDVETLMLWETTSYYLFSIIACNKLFKSKTWGKIRFAEGKYSEDNFAFSEYIQSLSTISVIREPLYYYQQRPTSLIHTYSVKNLDSAEARLDRTAYYLSIHRKDLAENTLLHVSNALLAAYTKLDMSKQSNYSRYYELYKYYKELYKATDCKIKLSLYSMGSALYIKSDYLAAIFYKAYHSIRQAP